MVLKFRYLDYSIQSSVELRGDNLEVEFISNARAHIDLPQILDHFFLHVTNGGTVPQFCNQQQISLETIISGTKSYLAILLAGYEVERYFFSGINGLKYYREKSFEKKYSQDMTAQDIQHDLVKAKMLIGAVFGRDLILEIENQVRSVIRKVLSEREMRNAFKSFYKYSNGQSRINSGAIDTELQRIGFYEWSSKMILKLKLNKI